MGVGGFFLGGEWGHELKLGPLGGQNIISSSVGWGSQNQMSDFYGRYG